MQREHKLMLLDQYNFYPEGSRTRSDSNGVASTPCLFQKLTEM